MIDDREVGGWMEREREVVHKRIGSHMYIASLRPRVALEPHQWQHIQPQVQLQEKPVASSSDRKSECAK